MATQIMEDKCSQMFGPLIFEYNHNLTSSETKCLLCEEVFDLSLSVRLFLIHIFDAHNVVIDDVQNIEKLPEYIMYWRKRLSSTSLEEIIPSLNVDCTGHKYFLLSALLKEDKEVRHKLKLEHVLEVQEFERNNKDFKKPCLFCRLEFEGTRHAYLEHLSTTHNILLGNPQNIVYVEELVDKLDKKMKDLQCIYCEKTFPDRNILKEHMRKKLHKRINPKTTDYDKYYIVNYLEADKTWRDIEKEDDRYAAPAGVEPNGDEEYSDWHERDDYITCLLCDVKETDVCILCMHMEVDHGFDFIEQTGHMDFYEKVKLVNYIRKQVHDHRCIFCDSPCADSDGLHKHLSEEKHYRIPEVKVFNQPEYFFPTYENDTFLYHLEDFQDK